MNSSEVNFQTDSFCSNNGWKKPNSMWKDKIILFNAHKRFLITFLEFPRPHNLQVKCSAFVMAIIIILFTCGKGLQQYFITNKTAITTSVVHHTPVLTCKHSNCCNTFLIYMYSLVQTPLLWQINTKTNTNFNKIHTPGYNSKAKLMTYRHTFFWISGNSLLFYMPL